MKAVCFYQDTNNNGVWDSADTLLATNTSISGGKATYTVSTSSLTAGSYRYFARALDNDGNYSSAATTTIAVTTADDFGNAATTASAIAFGSKLTGTIETGGDQDWFKFTAVAGKTYTIGTELNGVSDTVLYLYSTDGKTVIKTNDDAGSSNPSVVDHLDR